MKFEDILNDLKNNKKFYRSGWNGKNIWVQRSQSQGTCEPYFCIYNENNGKTHIWVPSISDLFAEDWILKH